MPDQSNQFSHITVTPAEEEDFVIEAGVRAAESAPAPAPAPAPVVPEPVAAPSEAAPAASAEQAAAGRESSSPQASQQAGKQKTAKPKPQDNYRETTLEDLKSEPMSFTQKAVIVVAILCLIGAIVYCVAFMR